MPLEVSVTLCCALCEPTCTVPKFIVFDETVTAGTGGGGGGFCPWPLNVMERGLPEALSQTKIVVPAVDAALGV